MRALIPYAVMQRNKHHTLEKKHGIQIQYTVTAGHGSSHHVK